MTNDQIENILRRNNSEMLFEIRFKTRKSIKGIFIKTSDYKELSRKNLWRIVSESRVDAYKRTADESLARIFNGTEFTKVADFS